MRRKWSSLLLVFGSILALAIFFPLAVKTAWAESGEPLQATFDAEKCRLLLEKTAARLGWPEPEIYVNDYGIETSCQMSYLGSQDGVPIKIDIFITIQPGWCDDCAYYCESEGNQNNCRCVDIHGLPGRLTVPQDSPGTFLTFCDPYCSLVFRVNTLSEDDQPVDPQPAADALYYSALEINCCQAVEAVPPAAEPPGVDPVPPEDGLPTDELLPPDNSLSPIPEVPPGEAIEPSKPLFTQPVIPLIGALIGTLAGWLVSVVVTNWPVVQGDPVVQPSPAAPDTWEEWEKRYTPNEIPAYRGPDIYENRSVHISVEDAKSAVIQSFLPDLPVGNQARVANARMRKVGAAEFDAEYLKAFPKDRDYQAASAFVNPQTGEILVCTDREINYTPVHELMHVASDPAFRQNTNEAMDEAVTEYFTHKITTQRKIIRSSEYDELGSTDVVAEIVKVHGEQILRKAYFQDAQKGIEDLKSSIDQKLGPGAFDKVVELVGRPYARPKQMALDLLRGQGIRR